MRLDRCRNAVVLGFLLAWLPWSAQAAGDLSVTARLQPEVVGVDELVHLSIDVQGSGFGGRGFEPVFELENLEVVGGPSTSQSFRFVNGAASRSLTLSWVLRPLAVGTARVHAIEVQVEDEVYELPEQVVEVKEDAVGRTEPQGRGLADPFEDFFPSFNTRNRRQQQAPRQIFLRAEVEPKDPYVGQQALYTLYLFTQMDVTSISPEQLPDFAGLWVSELPQPAQRELEMVDIDGRQFGRVPVLRRAIFPLRAGEIELQPAKVQLSVRVPDRTFGSMFSETEQVRRDSNGVVVTARPLPTPAPPGFAGAVGSLKVAAELTPSELALGDAATYSVTLSGVGHLQGLPAPSLPAVENLRTFPPEQESHESVVGRQVRGRRTWSFVLVPEEPGVHELPAIEFPYFDPLAGVYKTARAEAATLRVGPPAAVAAVPEPPSDALSEAGEVGPHAGAYDPKPGAYNFDWMRVLPWALVALLLAAVALLLRKRSRDEGHEAAHGLKAALRLAASKQKPREAAGLIEDGWRSFLEGRWKIPPGTPSTQWGKHLAEAGAPSASAESLVALADDLHYLRYAPQLSDTDALKRELILRSTKLSRTLK